MVLRSVFFSCVTMLLACGPSDHARSGHGGKSPSSKNAKGDGEVVEEKVTYERMPDGSVKKTTTRTTRRTVEAPPPPARPADPWPSDKRARYNVERINAYRAQKGLEPVLYDAKISSFARAGSERLSRDHVPHANFAANAQGAPGFGSRSAENQGDPNGVPVLDPDATTNGKKQIDIMLKLMMDEGPGGGHYDNMMNPKFRRVGVGFVDVGGRFYMTNDFSD
ncbi:hypothetical protein AKJ09_06018 [Labilithrix luteola]|uniref:SCP domain-containing protein n=1 Tax=Labilithrix luteola TaxID=1391654 RepID=A0A0K1Q1V9_9BACT|nr:CAP domain-containing protein [Labilithrix luteola]AKU99354.1 hypothetical protein AKJ09_06018 [Labilithrix luteola]